ncbi:TetR/AcrR family transcriptional regulator [Iamia sp. SCSIO 61187]|uniref:TetR/AcrR family transcriptional regulator n=1 Tax=Iamia sp. SCSIO 61187 TaxID=2722752 RepID=UPI001C62FE10|nr:TetR/AcrR family transcriptional regulator [Iamia sp. SCSIO 61187]QYG91535.1 TetR/AcrR family transcriptional regulator [Iamia sp. SCSIO 61187]
METGSTTARPRSRRGEGERLREEILAAAEALLVETASEDAVSIRAVAQAVGVTAPSIYRHFADKDMLLLEVCRHSFTDFSAALEDALGADDTTEQMVALGRAYIRYAVEHPEHYRIMFMARFELSAQAYAEEMVADGSSFALLLRISQELIDSGRVRPEIAERGALHVGILFWSSVHGLASLLVAKPGLPWPDPDVLEEHLLAGTVRGLLVPEG